MTGADMGPLLEVIAGPLKGEVFPLAEDGVSIGREPANQVSILDSSVSRRHCWLGKQGEQFRIRDLESRNGTFVNGLPVTERALEDGDQIKIGSSLFLFLASGDELEASNAVEFRDTDLAAASTVVLRRQEALPAAPGLAREGDLLWKISRAISSIRGLPGLERRLLELIGEVAPAERGAILLIGDRPGELASVFGWDRYSGPDRPVQVSRALIDRVLREGVAVMSDDAGGGATLPAGQGTPIRAAMAAPLEVFGKIVGAIYLDTSNPQVRFEEDLLRLLSVVGSLAALALDNARRLERLEGENRRLQAEINVEHNMVGESPPMREVYQFAAKVARSDSTVLIRGESGTGKELVARAIHRNSPRAVRPFAAINCAVLTETLLESELFGHEKGAFTGAVALKKGKLEAAEGGTVFLDEVAELTAAAQAKLLRAVQEREFERVGGTRPIKVDIRLIAATNQDLEEAVKKGLFRQDLYYRLNVVSMTLPPLRERREDIPLLARYFAARFADRAGWPAREISPEAQACLVHYDWPGNVRELENAIERALVLGSSDRIRPEDLPETVLEKTSPSGAPLDRYHEAIQEAKRQVIRKAVEQAGGHTEAARLLGVHPNYLHRLLRNLNLREEMDTRALSTRP